MKFIVMGAIVAGVMAGGGAMAADMPSIAKKNGCNACHAIDSKVVGPAWVEVARKYRGDGTARARLAGKIMRGGSGVWGAMPMPGTPGLSEAEADMLAEFVLSLAR